MVLPYIKSINGIPAQRFVNVVISIKIFHLRNAAGNVQRAVPKNERDLLASQNILRKGISELESMDKSNGRKTEVPYVIIQESHSLQ